MSDKEIALKVLKDRLALISRGICIEPVNKNKPVHHLQSYYGGTGPRGKQYYVCYQDEETPERMISLPIYPSDHYLAAYAVRTKRSPKNPHDLIADNGVILKGVPPHSRKHKAVSTGLGIELIVENHPYDTKAINVSASCRHFENNEKCKFCTTDVGMETLNVPKRVSYEEVMEAVKLNLENIPNMRSITVSGGTIESPDKNLSYMVGIAKRIKEWTDLSLYFQLEPCDDMSLLQELSQYAEGLGICLDIFDERVRKEICPGKAKTSLKKYFDMWKKSVEFFGKGNVETHCLIGLGEDINLVLDNIKKCVALGVRVTPLHIRAGSKDLGEFFVPTYLEDEERYLKFHIEAAKIMKQYGMDYRFKDGPGCIGCKGCNAIIEACEYAKLLDE